MTATNLANIADTLTRNEILSSNELRALLGFRPVADPRADELRNKNLNASDEQMANPISTNDDPNVEPSKGSPLDQPLSNFQ